MEDWVGYVQPTDRLDTEPSTVFKYMGRQRGGSGGGGGSGGRGRGGRGGPPRGVGGGAFGFGGFGGDLYYSCQLCRRRDDIDEDVLIHSDMRGRHAQDPLHQQRATTMAGHRDAMASRAVQTARFLSDAQRFRSIDLEASIGRYILFGGPNNSNNASLDDIEHIRFKLKRSEPMVQLELALWKAACESNPPDDNVVRSPHQWKAWFMGGWKAHKSKARDDPLVTTIPALVAPYLKLKKTQTSDNDANPSVVDATELFCNGDTIN